MRATPVIAMTLGMAAMATTAFAQRGGNAATAAREFVYKKTPQGDLKLYVHFPAGWTTNDKRPGIIFFFGGAWIKGSPTQFIPQADYFAGRGMVAARADYRVGITPAVCVEDARSAVRWFRAHAGELGLDPDRIVGSGGSAGGHLAACCAMTDTQNAKGEDGKVSSRPNALVLFNPVLIMEEKIAAKLKGISAAEVQQISPIEFMRKDTPPAIVFYGTKDQFLEQGRKFLAKSRATGNRVELYSVEGQPHGFFNRSPWTEVTLRQADEFLVSLGYLKGHPTMRLPQETKASLKKEK